MAPSFSLYFDNDVVLLYLFHIGFYVLFAVSCTTEDQFWKERISPVEDGYVVMDDGVNIYYQVFGSGAQVIVVPSALYLADHLASLAPGDRDRRIIFYDPRGRGRSSSSKRLFGKC